MVEAAVPLPNLDCPRQQPQSVVIIDRPASSQPLSPSSPPQPSQAPLSEKKHPFGLFAIRRPPVRLTTEFDSDSSIFLSKISSKFLDGFAKLKVSFQNNSKGEIADPQLALVTKYLSVHYDVGEQNALVKSNVDVGPNMQLRALHDIRHISICCFPKEQNALLKVLLQIGSMVQLRAAHYLKAKQGDIAMVANIADPAYKFELESAVPSVRLPKASLRFPSGRVSVEEKEDEEAKKILSINGILKGQILNGLCTAKYKDDNLNLRYCYKDKEMSFIPSISLPTNALSFAFKRQFSPSDKLSYWYNFDSNYWSTVYKHTVGKDYKFKAGYDSEVRLGWASLWVGDESGKAKSAPMKMKVQFMLQVPQDDIKYSVLMFRVKKRWDL